jgi:hypothetical protein
MIRFCTLFVLLLSFAANGQEHTAVHPYLSSKYFASVGLFRPDQSLRLGLDGSVDLPDSGPSPFVDFSQSFGISNTDESFSAEIGWRFGSTWQLRGQYFRVDNSSRATLEQDIEWGDYDFNAGTSVAVGTDMQITRLFFGRTFRSSESRELGLGIGAHVLDLEAYIRGSASIDGVDVGFRNERASVAQPLPNIGIWYMYAFNSNWAANLRFDWLAANVGKYDGHIINSSAWVGYAIGEHVGLSLAYNFFEIELGIDNSNWQGRANVRFNGPYISLTAYW